MLASATLYVLIGDRFQRHVLVKNAQIKRSYLKRAEAYPWVATDPDMASDKCTLAAGSPIREELPSLLDTTP